MHRIKRGAGRIAYLVGFALIGAYALIALKGPQGIPALLAKHREIRQLEEQNAAMAHENQLRRERIERLKNSPSEQDMVIRKQLKLQKQGETTFILPDAPKDGAKDSPHQ